MHPPEQPTLAEHELITRRTRTVLAPQAALLTDLEEVGRVIVFGGVLRDLYSLTPSLFDRDVDLVIDGDPAAVDALCLRSGGKRNRFGGYRLLNKGRMLDIWPLSRTWALSNGLVTESGIQALLSTTYFSSDSIAYDLKSGHLYTGPDYFERRRARLVGLVLAENPHPAGALLRTLRLVAAQYAKLDWRLASQTEKLLAEHWTWLTGEARGALHALGVGTSMVRFRNRLDQYLASGKRDEHFAIHDELPREGNAPRATEQPALLLFGSSH